MWPAIIAGGASLLGGMFASSGARSAANTQAQALLESKKMSLEEARKTKGEILDRMVPAFSTYRQQMDASRDEIMSGETDVFRILEQAAADASQQMGAAGTEAQRAILGQGPPGSMARQPGDQYARRDIPGSIDYQQQEMPFEDVESEITRRMDERFPGAADAPTMTPEEIRRSEELVGSGMGIALPRGLGGNLTQARAQQEQTAAEAEIRQAVQSEYDTAAQAIPGAEYTSGRPNMYAAGMRQQRAAGGAPGRGEPGGPPLDLKPERGGLQPGDPGWQETPQYGFAGAQGQLERGEERSLGFLERGIGQGRRDVRTGREQALGQLASAEERAMGRLEPYSAVGQEASQREAALSGALGPEAQRQAQAEFMESPGQKYLRERQEQSLLRNQAAIGGLGGGRVRTALQEQAMGIAATQQQQALGNLRSIASRGQQVAGAEAGLIGGMGQTAAGVTQQAGTQLATLAQSLGMSQADIARLSAGQQAQLAERTGLNVANIQQAVGTAQAGLTAGLGGQLSAARAGSAADIAGLYGTQAATEMQSQQDINALLANLSTLSGSQAAQYGAQAGGALAAGQLLSGQAMQQGLGGAAGAALYGLGNMQQTPQQSAVGSNTWNMQNPGLANLPVPA